MSNQPSDAITRAHLGRRVTLRRVVGERDGRPLFSDVVGELIDVRDDLLVVRRRDGSVVEVDSGSVAAAKVVPDQNRPLSAIDWSEPELERVAAQGWRALEVERLGEWLLRASAGFSRRANSVLPLGVSGLPLDNAIDVVERWYADRGLPAQAQIPTRACADVDARLDERGWLAVNETWVMVADVQAVLLASARRDDLPPVVIENSPSTAWLATYHYSGNELPAAAVHTMSLHERVGFASVADDKGVLAIVRGAIDERWLGLTAVETVERARRRGLASHAVRTTVEWAARQGARHVYLQVADQNHGAIAMYQRLGFVEHHRNHYRRAA